MSFSGLLDKTCVVHRSTATRGPLGTSKAFAVHLAAVACRREQRSGAGVGVEVSSADRGVSRMPAEHALWVDFGTDVTKSDRVVMEGVTYEVIGVDPDVAGAGHHMRLQLLEVR